MSSPPAMPRPALAATAPSDAVRYPTSHRMQGLLLAVLGAVAFSGKAIIVKVAYRYGVDAITLIMYRMLFALPAFLLMAWWAGRGRPAMSVRDWLAVLGLGFSGYYLASTLDFLGLQYITAGLERLILYVTPGIVMLLAWWRFGRRVSRQQLMALAVSYCGLLLVFGREASLVGPQVALGAALVVASTLSYGLYLLYSAEVLRRLGSMRLTGWASTVACVLCLLQFVLLRPMAAAAVAPPVLWLSVLNALVCTVAPVWMVMMAIERVGPSTTAQAGMIGPLSTILMGVWLLGEPFTAWIALGTLFVLGGIGLLVRSR